MDAETLITQNVLKSVPVWHEHPARDFTTPVKVTHESNAKKFLETEKIQILLGEFGGTYKKNIPKGQYKTQSPIYPKDGQEIVDKFITDSVFGSLSEDKMVSKGCAADTCLSNILGNTWLFGHDTQMKFTGQTPNGHSIRLSSWSAKCLQSDGLILGVELSTLGTKSCDSESCLQAG